MQTSDRGICRKFGIDRTKANHKKCDAWLVRAGGWRHIVNNETTTGKDLKRIAESVGDDTPIAFSVKILWYARDKPTDDVDGESQSVPLGSEPELK